MFYIHSIAGRVFSGSLEQLRQVAPASAITRSGRIAAPGHEPRDASGGPATQAAGGEGRRAGLAAYAATEHGAQQRQPLTRVADVMSRRVLTLRVDASVAQAWQMLAREGYGQAPVVDGSGALVGIFLHAELMRAGAAQGAAGDAAAWRALLAQPVQALMWTPVPAALPDTELRRVASVLLDSGLPGLPVVDEQGGVTGFVSRSDILRAVIADPPLDLWG